MLLPYKKIVFGPWVGELGHELFCWQGFIRKFVKNKKFKEITIISRPGHQILYQDFCNNFIELDVDFENTSGPLSFTNDLTINQDKDVLYLNPKDFYVIHDIRNLNNNKNFEKQEFISLKKNIKKKYDILFHVRNMPLKIDKINRNYCSNYSFETIVQEFNWLKFGCIGHKKWSNHIKGTEDLRGLTLNNTVEVMNKSSLLIGPCSGPIHLAALCELPYITWSGINESEKRCKFDWNPFKIDVIYFNSKVFPMEISNIIQKGFI